MRRVLDDGSVEITETLPKKQGVTIRHLSATGEEWWVVDPEGGRTTYAYDEHHRRVQVTMRNGDAIALAYLGDGNQTSAMNVGGKTFLVDPRARWEGRALVVPALGDQQPRVIIADPLPHTEAKGPTL